MTSADSGGRMLQTGRTLARILLVWTVSTGALVALDRWLTDFDLPAWWHPPVAALLLGLLTAGIWPLVLRVALPLALFTFGIGGFLLLAALVLVVFSAIPGVVIGLDAAVVVTLAMAAVAGVISSVLAIDEDEAFFRRALRRTGRGALRSAEDPPAPGVLFLQIDGLGHDVARRAVRGSMPTPPRGCGGQPHADQLAHRLELADRRLGDGHPARLEPRRDRLPLVRQGTATTSSGSPPPQDAAALERRHSDGRGPAGAPDGARHGNLFTGDAPERQPHHELAGPRRARPPLPGCSAAGEGAGTAPSTPTSPIPVNAVRTLGVSLVDVVPRAVRGRPTSGAPTSDPRSPRGGIYPLARPGDDGHRARHRHLGAARGHAGRATRSSTADFLGYERGGPPLRRRALRHPREVLRSIDQQIGRLHRAAAAGPPRLPPGPASPTTARRRAGRSPSASGRALEELVGRVCGGGTGAQGERARGAAAGPPRGGRSPRPPPRRAAG